MHQPSDYSELLADSRVASTPHRLKVLEVIGRSPYPLSHREIYSSLKGTHPVNRVTLYRILDLLVENKLIERISSGDRSFRYGLASNTNDHSRHPHFFCSKCGHMGCLDPKALNLDIEPLLPASLGLVMRVEVRLDGICRSCLTRQGVK